MTSVNNDHIRFHNILNCGAPPEVLAEVKHIISLVSPDFDYTLLERTHADISRLFNGVFPGYRASTTKYHNLEHTNAVFLAQARLTHGLFLNGKKISARAIELGLLAALFHDTGLIQTEDDLTGTGAKYMIGHEARSIAMIGQYLAANGKSPLDIEDCAQMIKCTILHLSPSAITFSAEEIKLMGHVLGTADLLAQMAERNYLEKLALLFLEFQEGGIPGYDSQLDLIQKTESFYKKVALKRLDDDFGRVGDQMRDHFRSRWQIDDDLYARSLKNQIDYLKSLDVYKVEDDKAVLRRFRRGI